MGEVVDLERYRRGRGRLLREHVPYLPRFQKYVRRATEPTITQAHADAYLEGIEMLNATRDQRLRSAIGIEPGMMVSKKGFFRKVEEQGDD